MEDIVGWSRIVHGTGMRGLERSLGRNRTADPLLSYGLNLVVSDYAPDDVRAMMQTAADGSYQRGCVPVDVLRAMGSHAPAFGMVGTLIGMVSMLHSLTNDVEVIGGTLAVAFLSTLYGVLSARMIYLPAASRLEREVEAQCLRDNLVTEGMVMLARLKSPTFIRDRLNAFLQPRARNYFNVIDGGVIDGGVIDGGVIDGGVIDDGVIDDGAEPGTDALAALSGGGRANGGRAGRADGGRPGGARPNGARVLPRLLLQVAK
jgi:flagellar motor component MotA